MIRTTKAPAFSMRKKTKPTDLRRTIEAQNNNPGAAAYDNNSEMSKTLYASHFKQAGGHGFADSKRFSDSSTVSLTQTTKFQAPPTTRTAPVCLGSGST